MGRRKTHYWLFNVTEGTYVESYGIPLYLSAKQVRDFVSLLATPSWWTLKGSKSLFCWNYYPGMREREKLIAIVDCNLDYRVYEPLEFDIQQVHNRHPKFLTAPWYHGIKSWLLEGINHHSVVKLDIKPVKKRKVRPWLND